MLSDRPALKDAREIFAPKRGVGIRLGDSSAISPFGRLRTAYTTRAFDSLMRYDASPLFWEDSGSGTVTHIVNEAAVQLSVAAGENILRQTKQYFLYKPGEGQLIYLSGVLGAVGESDVIRRLGYYDNGNGIFFELSDVDGLRVVQRSKVSGSVVDLAINQSEWNIDKMDGTGPSKLTINTAYSQIFVIDLQWLGVGQVSFGFVQNGEIYYCHKIKF